MGRVLRTGVSALAFAWIFAGPAAASQACARPDEMSAIQAAAVQQELMVAALTCNEVARFNAFQQSYGSELRASDATLLKMFKRLQGARRGEEEYHAFKTRLANAASRRSIAHLTNFCAHAGMVFDAALSVIKPTLVNFVAGQEITTSPPYAGCEIRVAVGGLQGFPAVAAIPKPKPVLEVLPAQATTLPAPAE